MDDSKIEIPAWLPWGTTAILAALVACLGELWMVEKTRTDLLRDENTLAAAALKAAENQLEAERIVDRREIEELKGSSGAEAGLNIAVLSPSGRYLTDLPAPGSGAVVWKSQGNRATLIFAHEPGPFAQTDYQLWLVGPGQSSSCGVFGHPTKAEPPQIPIELKIPVAKGCQFLLFEGKKGGARTIEEARATGSIVLASLPWDGRILNQ
jgi:hypothetical protein